MALFPALKVIVLALRAFPASLWKLEVSSFLVEFLLAGVAAASLNLWDASSEVLWLLLSEHLVGAANLLELSLG
jgi:hypothetical protein